MEFETKLFYCEIYLMQNNEIYNFHKIFKAGFIDWIKAEFSQKGQKIENLSFEKRPEIVYF